MKPLKIAQLEIHLAVLLFGFSGLFGKWLVTSPVWVVEGRTFFAAIAIFAGLTLTRVPLQLPKQHWGLIVFSALVLALHWLTFFYAIQLSTVAIGLIGFSTYPVFVTLVEPLLNRQKLRSVDSLSAAVVLVGLLVLAPGLDFNHSTSQGLFWAVVSGALNAVFTLVNRQLVVRVGTLNLVLFQQIIVSLLLLPWVIPTVAEIDANTVILLAVLGLLFTAIPQTLYVHSLSQLKAQFVSIVTCMEPVYSIVLAAILLGEVPSLKTLAGAALVMLAVFIAVRFHKTT